MKYLWMTGTAPAFTRYAVLAIVLCLPGCAGLTRTPLPAEQYQEATVLTRGDLRFWGDRSSDLNWSELRSRSNDQLVKDYPPTTQTQHSYLALSGGGANGAYGAGLLSGWSEAGTRPEFAMVTGISIGALTAPFAFLGSDYDGVLREVYSTLDSSSIYKARSIVGSIRKDSLVDSTPLAAVLEKYVTKELVAAIGVQYLRGRSLFIGTTNLDAGRPVIWNVGRIAASGDPDAVALIRQVLQASASIPGAFPPVYIDVQGVDGNTYDEMHVDGGTSSQMFLYPQGIDWAEVLETLKVDGRPTAYLIRNSYLEPDYDPVPRKLLPIVGRTVDSLVRTQGQGDIYRIYTLARRDGIDVKISWIPNGSVGITPTETFDPVYMRALFEFGYQRGLAQDGWIDVAQQIERNMKRSPAVNTH
ncbi:MAG: patatin-like phospholipase family protein [Halioglobus sp.]